MTVFPQSFEKRHEFSVGEPSKSRFGVAPETMHVKLSYAVSIHHEQDDREPVPSSVSEPDSKAATNKQALR